MRFSRWRAAGNEYLLAERSELGGPLTPERVRDEVGSADGILEVVSADGDEAEIVIWNPDGSIAEMSGNGTRIAARWLAERSGADEVRIRVGPREVTARMLGDEVEQELGPVEVYERERVAGLEVTAVSVGNPHAVVVGDPDDIAAHRAAARDASPLPGAHERPGRAGRRPGPRDRARLGARRGGDALLRDERRRSRGCDARRGRSRRLVSRRGPPGAAGRWPCMADRARRARRVTAAAAVGACAGWSRPQARRATPVTLTVSPSASVDAGTPCETHREGPPASGARACESPPGAARFAECLRSPCVATYRGRPAGSVRFRASVIAGGKVHGVLSHGDGALGGRTAGGEPGGRVRGADDAERGDRLHGERGRHDHPARRSAG